jgi:ribonucleoside-triphosphate reductase
MHAHQSRWYIRRIRFQQDDPLVKLIEGCGFYVEKDLYSPNTVVAEFPVEAPGAHEKAFRGVGDLTIEEQLDTQATLQKWWSDNSVSATITFRPKERRKIAGLLREYSNKLKCTTLLPYTEVGEKTTFKQMPYEPITEKKYKEILAQIKHWPQEEAKHLREQAAHEYQLVDLEDCASGACPIR